MVLWDLAVGCGPGMPGPYKAAMGKQDIPAGRRAAYMRPLQMGGSLQLRGFGALACPAGASKRPEFKVEKGSAALRTDSNTASV